MVMHCSMSHNGHVLLTSLDLFSEILAMQFPVQDCRYASDHVYGRASLDVTPSLNVVSKMITIKIFHKVISVNHTFLSFSLIAKHSFSALSFSKLLWAECCCAICSVTSARTCCTSALEDQWLLSDATTWGVDCNTTHYYFKIHTLFQNQPLITASIIGLVCTDSLLQVMIPISSFWGKWAHFTRLASCTYSEQ